MNPEDIKKQAVNRGRDAIASLRRDFTPRDFNALPPVPGQIPSAPEPVRRVFPQNKPLTPTQFAVSALKPITQPIVKTVEEAFIKPRVVTAQRIGQVISELKPKAENIKRIEAKYNPLNAKSVPRAALSLLQKGKDPKSVALSVAQTASKDLQDYVSDYVSGTLTALDAPNRAIIRPAWDNIKIKLAQDRNQNVDVAGVLQGSKTLSLPDILQINPNSLDYQAYRFLDFAPELINVPGGGTGKTVSLAKKVKLPQEGLFDEVAQDAAQKFARETGEALSKEVVDRAKEIAKSAEIELPKEIENNPIVNKKTGETLNQAIQKMKDYGWREKDITRYRNAILGIANDVEKVKVYNSAKSLTVFHVTSNSNKLSILNEGFKKGTELPENAFRGGGYGQIQDSISFAENAKSASIFAQSPLNTIFEVRLRPNIKIMERPDIEKAEDLNKEIPELLKQGIDAVKINSGEDEIVIINKEVIDKITKTVDFSAKQAKDVENLLKTSNKLKNIQKQAQKTTQSAGKLIPRKEITPAEIAVQGELGGVPPSGKTTETTDYVRELVKRQKQAREAGAPTLFQRLKNVANEVDVKLQDFTTPINQAVNNAIKTGKKIAPSENPIFQIDRVLRSNSIASQYVKDNGLASIIQKADNLDEFNQYLIAKSTQELKKIRPNVKTGRNAEADAKLLADLGPKYDALANQVFEYNNNLLNQVRASGLISGDLYNTLIKNRENYVPLQRIFAEIEDITQNLGTKQVASIGKQSVVKKLEGSEREIVNPLESMLTNTYQAISQIERNAAAQQIAKLVDRGIIPGEKLGKGEKFNSNEVISFLENGEKVNVFVGKDIARAAKNLNKENTNFLVGLLSVPTRILQAGATGLNTTFILSNLIRDQLTTAIVAGKPFRNTIFNPINFVKAMFDVYGDSKIYDDFLRAGAGFSSLDLTRDTSKTVKQLRAESSGWKKAGFNVTNPANLLNAVEDFIGRAETVTRLQVFKNARDDFRRQGYSAEDAETLAADLARNVTANFARRGEFGTVLNSVIPFFNATVQGTRTLRNAFAKDRAKTTALFATTVGIPVATTTLWNISDPERKKVYDSIPEFEKERNFIILPPVITYDEKGYPFFIRIPKPQGFSNLADPIRKLLEGSYESAPDAVMNVANNLLAATTGYQIPTDEQSRRQLTSQFTPQILKPFIEASTGVNLFTGQRIIPMGLEKLPPEEQVKETTSFTARQIGKALGVSPLLVENTVRTSTAEVGTQLLNLSDRLFAPAGTPQEQVGGRDPLTGLVEVFYRARGGADVEKIYKDIEKIDQEKGLLNLKVKDAILKNDTETIKQLSPFLTKQQFSALENSVSEKEIAKTLNPTDKALFKLSVGQLESLKQARPDLNEKIAEIEGFREQFKERTRFDTSGFRFKSTGLKLPKVKTITAKKPRIRKAPKLKKARIPKIKKRKPIKISGVRLKRRKPRNI